MLRLTISSLALVGAIVGGFALIKVGPIIGPINFNRESPLLSEDDEQRARALRIAAERKAERAAEKRAEAEQQAAEAAKLRKIRDDTGVKTELGNLYTVFCRDTPGIPDECVYKTTRSKCPASYASGEARQWKMFFLPSGILVVC